MCVFKEVGEERDAKRKKGISEKKNYGRQQAQQIHNNSKCG